MRTDEYTQEDGTRTVRTYDDNGHLIKLECLRVDGDGSIETYNDLGHLLKVEDFEADGSVKRRITYRWDGNNNVERIVTDGSGNQIWRLFFKFAANRALGYEEFDASDKLVYRFEYGYGEPEGKIRVKVFDGLGKLIKETLEDFV